MAWGTGQWRLGASGWYSWPCPFPPAMPYQTFQRRSPTTSRLINSSAAAQLQKLSPGLRLLETQENDLL